MSELEKAELIATLAHYGQVTRSEGTAFIAHPRAVAATVEARFKPAAWLHDVLEDSPLTANHLLAVGIAIETVVAVELVTRHHGENYAWFIDHIARSRNECAITVKLADLWHNLRPGCPGELARRYLKAVPVLEAALRHLLASEDTAQALPV